MLAFQATDVFQELRIKIVGKHEILHIFKYDRSLDFLDVLIRPNAIVDDIIDFFERMACNVNDKGRVTSGSKAGDDKGAFFHSLEDFGAVQGGDRDLNDVKLVNELEINALLNPEKLFILELGNASPNSRLAFSDLLPDGRMGDLRVCLQIHDDSLVIIIDAEITVDIAIPLIWQVVLARV